MYKSTIYVKHILIIFEMHVSVYAIKIECACLKILNKNKNKKLCLFIILSF